MSREISSRPALESLRAQRRPPAPQRAYTIGGHTQSNVHSQLDAERENRIQSMESRLADIKGHASAVFSVSQQRGRASRDFEHSR